MLASDVLLDSVGLALAVYVTLSNLYAPLVDSSLPFMVCQRFLALERLVADSAVEVIRDGLFLIFIL